MVSTAWEKVFVNYSQYTAKGQFAYIQLICIPIIYVIAERIFSFLKHLVTYFHSTNAEELTDSYDLISVA